MANNHKKYDARNLSSGEKLIWYTLLIMNYIKKIGVLVIDEPENHLHEQLAWNFAVFLKNEIAVKQKSVNQIFMITHSKNMVYNNFSLGVNYVINMDGELLLIEKENCEDILRKCGVSYIDDYILFVEGNTESDLLSKYCERNNIKLRKMSNCAEIIQTYKSLVKVKDLLYAPKFVFMIDADTRHNEDITKIQGDDFNRIKSKKKNKYENMKNYYGALSWSSEWKKYCDGKRVFTKTVKELSENIGVTKNNLVRMIFDSLMESQVGQLYEFWNNEIMKKLKE